MRMDRARSDGSRRSNVACISSTSTTGRELGIESVVADFDCKYLEAREFVGRFDLAIRSTSRIRAAWDVTFSLLITYIATIWLYNFSFVEMHSNWTDERKNFFTTVDRVVDVFFWIDLFANFFFSYKDNFGHEVCNLWMIAKHYLCGFFFLNLAACLPASLVTKLIGSSSNGAGSSFNGVIRVARLQRASKLARLARLGRLARVFSLRNRVINGLTAQGDTTSQAIRIRGLRVFNLSVSLLWIVHVLACGWQLCAMLDSDINATWLARRGILHAEPIKQWVNALYFILTVFTTVGFGDMSAVTGMEICYVCVCMLIGAVVHSILVSEVICVVTQVDKIDACVKANVDLVEGFAYHASLDQATSTLLREWVSSHASGWSKDNYDVDGMTNLLTRRNMPGWLVDQMFSSMFDGLFCRNKLFKCVRHIGPTLLARIAMELALVGVRNNYSQYDIIYRRFETCHNVFFVLRGTFAYVGTADSAGGIEFPTQAVSGNILRDVRKLPLKHAGSNWWRSKTSGSHLHDTVSSAVCSVSHSELTPYQTFSRGSCFGQIEPILSIRHRACTARVESEFAEALSVRLEDFLATFGEAPLIDLKWSAKHEETLRLSRLARMTRQVSYSDLAASSIQRFVRNRWMVKGCKEKSAPEQAEVQTSANVKPAAHHDIDVGLAAHDEDSRVLTMLEEVKQLRDAVKTVESQLEVELREMPSRIADEFLSTLRKRQLTTL
eukprot:TRINITY_DN15139_c0_g2_i3.p1 TRINITY_DN15139_c0_g2~~TRINITY_DN15139_c0_g2_i3.p1  ORF type:complete len:723 (+),score=70.21 TRINITY_DN15139_c0_g2_i3:67-2235(+)